MNLSASALQAAVLKVLLDEISSHMEAVKARAGAAFKASGASQTVPELPDGTKVATVSYSGGGGNSAYISSEDALLAWVLANHPDEVEMVIRDGYKKKLTDAAKKTGTPIDPATGEIVPGITVKASRPFVSIRFKPGGKEAVAAAWRAGELGGVDIIAPAEIESPDEAA
jgi:hypothetical protein